MSEDATDGSESDHGEAEHDHGHEHGHEHEHEGHNHHHHDLEELAVAVLTISSSRSIDEDSAGDAIVDIVKTAGHSVAVRELVPDDYDKVQGAIDRFVDREDTDCVITTGGTGVTPDDVTIEAIQPLMDKHLPGFGELFRTLSYEEIGTKVVGTRSAAGISDGVPVFCLPGSENAVRLGTEEIIIEEAPHLAGLAKREEEPDDDETHENEVTEE